MNANYVYALATMLLEGKDDVIRWSETDIVPGPSCSFHRYTWVLENGARIDVYVDPKTQKREDEESGFVFLKPHPDQFRIYQPGRAQGIAGTNSQVECHISFHSTRGMQGARESVGRALRQVGVSVPSQSHAKTARRQTN